MSGYAGNGTRTGTVELRVDARPESLALVRLALGATAVVGGVPPDVIHDLKLAVTEACTNSIQHAYPDGTGAEDIVVRVSVGPGAVTVEVADDGIGFDPDGVAFVLTPDGERERGMGLPIIRTVMDTLEIGAKERGSRLVFSKRFERA